MIDLRGMGFYRGVNLGGWLSQCDYSQERLSTFITERDIAVIAGWGLDHVRIPIDYNILQREDGAALEEGYARIALALEWCRKHGLNTVLDLHKTAGFSFDEGEREAGFFDSEKYQERFYSLWQEMAKRFGQDPRHVAFELLNEVTEERFIGSWNAIAARCIEKIRVFAPDTVILVGSYHNNSAHAVPALALPADDRVVYNFHCYDPILFTHQGATWTRFIDPAKRLSFDEANMPEDYFAQQFDPALQTAKERNVALYCGEYGVIDRATPQDTVRWYRQIHETFERFHISRCAWSYKRMDFGLSDPRLDQVRDELIACL